MVKVLDWNGHDVPEELKELPPGRYVVEPVEAPQLTAEEEEDLIAALDEDQHEPGLPLEDVHAEMQRLIARAGKRRKTR